ncbi:MAG: DUF2330 domain-containing protein [Flavobacteriales bacterium]
MKKITALFFATLIVLPNAFSFCGFYVAKADTKIFNTTSEVIYVRNGNTSTITMSNDFQGDVKDFAMVVPVPTVLKKKDIRVMDNALFKKLDAYSGPRLVEYYDHNPCGVYIEHCDIMPQRSVNLIACCVAESTVKFKKPKVKIEAKYEVGVYDILILSTKESEGLKDWLLENDYKIPEGAEEVLNPYIKDNMKFFVAKVNLDRQGALTADNSLKPLQITFNSPKFMLPIRLGMANANGPQDMMIYFLTKNGRVETANYRTAKIPTDEEIPTFVRNEFGEFYKNTFDNAFELEGKDAVMLEYAWDVSSNTAVKCDPCVGPPPLYADFIQAGVDWFKNLNQDQARWDGSGGDYGSAFFTRLHVRYDRENFPQDLLFVETPNKENFQGRYILNNPARGVLDCDEAKEYLKNLYERRTKELSNLYSMASWSSDQHIVYLNSSPLSAEINKEFRQTEKNGEMTIPVIPNSNSGHWNTILQLAVSVGLLLGIAYLNFRFERVKPAVE